MVVLSFLFMLVLGAEAAEPAETLRPWGRDQVGVSVLPIPAHPLARQLEAGVAAGMEPGMVLVPLTDDATQRLVDEPGCRARPRCIHEVVHPGLGFVVDASVSGSTRTPVFVLRLLRNGVEVDRRSRFATQGGLTQAVADEVNAMLRPHHFDYRFYQRAVAGDPEAGDRLLDRYPDSPWAQAWRAHRAAEP